MIQSDNNVPSKPLEGLLVLDFSQFLAGPAAALRLADLGARVIKIERPQTGDICRQLYISNLGLDGDSTLFHSINRNKESYAANLKNPKDLKQIQKLIRKSDILISNFRPGVMARLGLDYPTVRELQPGLVYGQVSGYGSEGPWANKPGQDLLAQSLSGFAYLTGNADDPPTPTGIAIADLYTGAHLVQGIMACLVRRGRTGEGGFVEVSLLESILDLQFEVFTTHLNDGGQDPQRSAVNNAHAYLGAPYGIYDTADGSLAIAMGGIPELGKLIQCPDLETYDDPKDWFQKRDEIKLILKDHFLKNSTAHWLSLLEPADFWCADVLSWSQLRKEEAYRALDWEQTVTRENGVSLDTSRCPITIDGSRMKSPKGSPTVGQHNHAIADEFELNS